MFNPELLNKMFLAASMQRWNDHARPMPLTELDKQAHKMVVAHVLGREYEARTEGASLEWDKLIKYGFFDLMQRVSLTDIKPQVFDFLAESDDSRDGMISYTLKDVGGLLATVRMTLGTDLQKYLENYKEAMGTAEGKIVQAASAIASIWEYKIVHATRAGIGSLENPGKHLRTRIEKCKGLESPIVEYYLAVIDGLASKELWQEIELPEIENLNKDLIRFVDVCGRLRFQQRWAQSPRVPATSVLGHTLYVGYLAYLVLIDSIPPGCEGSSVLPWRHFFSALYHDLPEAMTRDIVSPVKKSAHLETALRDYERDEYIKILKLLELNEGLFSDMCFYLPLTCERVPKPTDTAAVKVELPNERSVETKLEYLDEFSDRYLSSANVEQFLFEETKDTRVVDVVGDKDALLGTLIKKCDELAAFIEASSSIAHGTTSTALIDAVTSMFEDNKKAKYLDVEFGEYYKYFKNLEW